MQRLFKNDSPMNKTKPEIVVHPVEEARRYVDNARDVLQKHGKYDAETNHYDDRKYVRAAGHYLWNGVLIMLNAVFHVNEKKGRISIDDYRLAVGRRDRKLLVLVNDAYDLLHLNMGYDGILDKAICDRGFQITTEIINRCAVMMPFLPAA